MKKTILALSFVTGFVITSCNTPVEKIEKAEDHITEAKTELKKAETDYITDMQNFRKESDEKIAANEKSIRQFNERISKEKKEAKAEYKKKIAELEKKNSDMKKKMDDYKAEGKESWEKFKAEFNHDMEELGKAFKDLTVKNVK
ncbi:MAG TPA: peptidase M23 [Bacteroidia bacterium]|jgi:uncharacterized protein YPO0396|nr:peptidase M23 [Bacteroidia bacterium]